MPGPRKTNAHASLAISGRRSELRRLLRLVDEFSSAHAMPAPVWYCARLALEEIVTNVLKYAAPQNAGRAIVIRLALDARELTLQIEDEAARFNPLEHIGAARGKDARDKARGGHGLLLVKELMDDFKYRRYRQKNIMTLKKKLV